MSRIRQIKPHFLHSSSMARVSRDAQLTFIRLWLLADDAGRAIHRHVDVPPQYLHKTGLPIYLYPGEEHTWPLVDGWLDELEREGCIVRYVVSQRYYVRIVNWRKHQRIAHPSRSRLPAEPAISPEKVMNRSGVPHEERAPTASQAAPCNDSRPIVSNSGATHEEQVRKSDEATLAGASANFS